LPELAQSSQSSPKDFPEPLLLLKRDRYVIPTLSEMGRHSTFLFKADMPHTDLLKRDGNAILTLSEIGTPPPHSQARWTCHLQTFSREMGMASTP